MQRMRLVESGRPSLYAPPTHPHRDTLDVP